MTPVIAGSRRVRVGTVLILSDADDRVALQLRDDRPDVPYGNHWGLFGGWCEPGERPADCAERELLEELGVRLAAGRLMHLRAFEWNDPRLGGPIRAEVYHCAIGAELDGAVLGEGRRYAFWARDELAAEPAVPRHRQILDWYWSRRP